MFSDLPRFHLLHFSLGFMSNAEPPKPNMTRRIFSVRQCLLQFHHFVSIAFLFTPSGRFLVISPRYAYCLCVCTSSCCGRRPRYSFCHLNNCGFRAQVENNLSFGTPSRRFYWEY